LESPFRGASRGPWHAACLARDHDELNAVAGAELPEDAGDMRLDRQGTQIKRFCDFAVIASPRDKAQYFELARADSSGPRDHPVVQQIGG